MIIPHQKYFFRAVETGILQEGVLFQKCGSFEAKPPGLFDDGLVHRVAQKISLVIDGDIRHENTDGKKLLFILGGP